MIERRNFKGGCEVRSDAAGHPMIAGYAAVFNTKSQKLGGERGFVEEIDSRAFEKTIKEADVRALANHDVNWLLGRRGNDTLRLSTDSTGVHYEIAINEKDPDGVRALAKVERGDWDGASFGFRTIHDDWNLRSEPRERRLLEVQLRDVGPVTYPAYLETTAYAEGAARSLAHELGVEYRDVETAFELGSIDELIEGREERERIVIRAAETRAAGDVAWGPEDGFLDLCDDVTAALNAAVGWRYCCTDAAVTLDRVLVRDYEDCVTYVVPIAVGDDREPVVSDSSEWVAVEQGWVAVDDARALAALIGYEARAGKTLSAASSTAINQAISQLQKLVSDAEAGSDGTRDVPVVDETNALDAHEVERRLRELQGPRRYAAGI